MLLHSRGCLLGMTDLFPFRLEQEQPAYVCTLRINAQVGLRHRFKQNLKYIVKEIRLKFLLIPLATISGTLLFSAFASLLLAQWSTFECMAVGSGFAYYSLSSILITQLKEASLGIQLATELGTIALLSNIFREMMALLGTSAAGALLRETCPYLGGRCQFDGRSASTYYTLFRERHATRGVTFSRHTH